MLIRTEKQMDKVLPYVFISPSMIMIMFFLLYPVYNIFYYSVRSYNANKPYADGFVGFDNFLNIFTKDKIFLPTLFLSMKWVVIGIALQLLMGPVIALVMNQTFKGRGVIRAMVFLPWAVSGVITSMMWSLMYNQHIGILNDVFMKLGFIDKSISWTSNTSTALMSTIVAELWRGVPFFAIMLLAALQSIPNELYEACDMDGGNRWDVFIHITLPYLKDTIVLSTLLRSVWEFNNVDLIFNLTAGGPMHLTTTLNMYVVNTAVRDSDFGYGSALSVICFLILAVFASAYLKFTNFGKDDM